MQKEIQEQAEKMYPSPNHPTGYAFKTSEVVEMERKAFKAGAKWMQERDKQSFELKLKEAYNLGIYRGKCQILYPNSKDPFITFEEYYSALPSPPKTK